MAVVPADSQAFPDGIARKGSTDYADKTTDQTNELEKVTITFTKLGPDGKPIPGNTESYTKDQVHVIASPQEKNKPYEMPTTDGKPQDLKLRILPHRIGGVIFVFVLLMVIFITNVPLRGMWSLLVIVVAVALVVIFITIGWIETIITWLALLDVRINMAGYMTIAVFLFIIWLVALLAFDRQRYIIFTPGQFKVCDEIGGGEQVYSTDGISFQKQRSDFFRHYVLGLGSGDLIVRTAGAQRTTSTFPTCCLSIARCRRSSS